MASVTRGSYIAREFRRPSSDGIRIRSKFCDFLNTSTFPSTESSLLRRVQAQDDGAWRSFVDLYGPLIYSWCRRRGVAREDASDVTQETFAAVARSVAAFDHAGAQGSLRGWLWTITRNKLQDLFRRRSPGGQATGGSEMQQRLHELPEQSLSESTDSFVESDVQSLLHRGLEQVQAEFEPRTWRAFCCVVLEGRDTASVAVELGMSTNHVRQVKSRVLRRLREQLGDFLP